jgi:hypothetical protein
MKRLCLLLAAISMLVTNAMAGFSVYYSDTAFSSDYSTATITPTVEIVGSTQACLGDSGYDQPAVMVNGNAWVRNQVFDIGSWIDVIQTFPPVTVPVGQMINLSYGANVTARCIPLDATFPLRPPLGVNSWYYSTFFDGSVAWDTATILYQRRLASLITVNNHTAPRHYPSS